QRAFALRGQLDPDAFRRAWQGVLNRHSALRTAFPLSPAGGYVQVVRRRVEVPFVQEDWRALPAAGQEAALEAYLREDRIRGFDPGSAPVMRVALFRTGEAAYFLVWSFHQMLLDGWSLPLVFRDLMSLYEAHAQGQEREAGGGRPYGDYVAWLRRQDLGRAECFWREALAGFATPTPLPLDGTGTAAAEAGIGEAVLRLGAGESAALLATGRRHGLTMNTLLQGAWGLLLARYSGDEEVLFGTTVSGRPAELPGVEEMVGLFINTLPVRVRVTAAGELPGWLAALQEQNLALREHEHTPLVQVQGWSDVPRGTPLFESIVVYENYPIETGSGTAERPLEVEGLAIRDQGSFPMSVVGDLLGGEAVLRLRFERRRLDAAAAGRVLRHLATLLAGIGADPERRLGELPMLDPAEREELLGAWHGPVVEFGGEPLVHEMVCAQALRTPRAMALVSADESLTYAELDRAATRLAHLLRARGVGPEVPVGVCMEPAPERLVAVLAVLGAGGAYLPLDPGLPAERLAFLLRDASVALVLTQEALAGRLRGHPVETLCVDAEGERIGRQREEAPATGVDPRNLAYVIYTSGSTGQPKGVLVPHLGVCNTIRAFSAAYRIGEGSRVLLFAPLHFDASVLDVFTALCTGAALVVARREEMLPGEELTGLLRRQRVTHAKFTPSALAATPWAELPELEAVMSGGEACSAEVVARWAPGRRFYNGYGPTETSVRVTVIETADGTRPPPLGRATANVRLYVLDRRGEPVPVGVAGELCVGGVQVTRGYLGRPELTAASFLPDPFGGAERPGARLYRTGDRVRWMDDGRVEFLGRVDEQVKVRGFRIEPGEIEAALVGLEGVREAVVVARDDAAPGAPGRKRLVAYVVPAEGARLRAAELREQLSMRLPDYMVPAAYVMLESVPLTANGKLDRRGLPAPERGAGDGAGVGPRTPAEEILCGIWAELLRVERVGVEESFFELGGDSILSIQVVSRARQRGLVLSPRQLFEHPTVARLAAVAGQARHEAGAPAAAQGPVTGEAPLTPIQRRFFAQASPAPHHFNQTLLLAPERALDPGRLAGAVAALVAHHDALRLRFRR
ncbi:MAG TPA: amino acid adenylation domain-containing protein, partial [Longimicrobiaceae bacterium]|nr:amino acid adenylation domain-containing protein [Longimicrobiaceae bacterium]